MGSMSKIKAFNMIFVNYAKRDMIKNAIAFIAIKYTLKQLMMEKIGLSVKNVIDGFT